MSDAERRESRSSELLSGLENKKVVFVCKSPEVKKRRRVQLIDDDMSEDDFEPPRSSSNSSSSSEEEKQAEWEKMRRRRSTRASKCEVNYALENIDTLYDTNYIKRPRERNAAPRTKKKKKEQESDYMNTDASSSSSDEEQEDDRKATRRRRRRQKKEPKRINQEEEDMEPRFIIDKILAQETHTLKEWGRICRNMTTHFLTCGSIFVSDGEERDQFVVEESDDKKHESTFLLQEQELFLVKWKGLSYHHVSWESYEALLDYDPSTAQKYKTFLKKQLLPYNTSEAFNPDFVQVDRILEVQNEEDEEIYVKWKSLGYEHATWERTSDVHDDVALNRFHFYNKTIRKNNLRKNKKIGSFRPYSERLQPVFVDPLLKLRDYQLIGVNWMLFNWYNDRNCLLADEMGLGKTVQTVTVIQHLIQQEQLTQRPYLIVAPLSTLHHWQREFTTWTTLNAIVYHGSADAREIIRTYEFYMPQTRAKSGSKKQKKTYRFQVLITSYEMLTNLPGNELSRIDWQMCVVDEAHRLKNPSSRLAMTLFNQFHYRNLLLLTGTPLQNNVSELWTLLHFLDRSRFDQLDNFVTKYGDLTSADQVEKLHEELKPFLLRRMKEDVEKNLAPKQETIIEVELTVLQKQYYRAIYEKNTAFLQRSGKGTGPSLMNILMEIRKCCNHPFLIRGVELRELERLQQEHSNITSQSEREMKIHQEMQELLVSTSGKLVLLDKLLPRLKENGHRVLIFSQFKIMLDILEDYLRLRGYVRERIDGSITGNDRQAAIDRFSNKESNSFIMLLSTRAGGVGINLTSADTVIIYDSDWNPQNDLQAQARCHRIGQQKTVKVYRLLTNKTYEKQMFHRASMKLGLDQAVLGSIQKQQQLGDNRPSEKKTREKKIPDLNAPPSKEEVERLLKYGAYEIFLEEQDGMTASKSKEFSEANLEEILQRSTVIIHDQEKKENKKFSSSFSKATFVSSEQKETSLLQQVDVNDPQFWTKIVGLPSAPEEEKEEAGVVQANGRRRRKTRKLTNYTESGLSYSRNEFSPQKKRFGVDEDDDFNPEEEEEEEGDGDEENEPFVSIHQHQLKKNLTSHDIMKAQNRLVSALNLFGYGRWAEIQASENVLGQFSLSFISKYCQGYVALAVRTMSLQLLSTGDSQKSNDSLQEKHVLKCASQYQICDRVCIDVAQRLNYCYQPNIVVLNTALELYNNNLEKKEDAIQQTVDNMVQAVVNSTCQEQQLRKKKIDRQETMKFHKKSMSILDVPIHSTLQNLVSGHFRHAISKLANLEQLYIIRTFVENQMEPVTMTSILTSSPWNNCKDCKSERKYHELMVRKNELISVSIPIHWWRPVVDDLKLVLGIYKHGWLRSQKQCVTLLQDPEFRFSNSEPTPSLAHLNKRLRALVKFWMTPRTNQTFEAEKEQERKKKSEEKWRQKQQEILRIHQEKQKLILAQHNAEVKRQNCFAKTLPAPSKSSIETNKAVSSKMALFFERRNRFASLVICFGLPESKNLVSIQQKEEKWHHFRNDAILEARCAYSSVNEMEKEGDSLECFCLGRLNGTTYSANKNWFLTVNQCEQMLRRIALFRALRTEILVIPPSSLRKIVHNVLYNIMLPVRKPVWWQSPDHDILLLQGIECFGMDKYFSKVWALPPFIAANNRNQSFPDDYWGEQVATILVQSIQRYLHEEKAQQEKQLRYEQEKRRQEQLLYYFRQQEQLQKQKQPFIPNHRHQPFKRVNATDIIVIDDDEE